MGVQSGGRLLLLPGDSSGDQGEQSGRENRSGDNQAAGWSDLGGEYGYGCLPGGKILYDC